MCRAENQVVAWAPESGCNEHNVRDDEHKVGRGDANQIADKRSVKSEVSSSEGSIEHNTRCGRPGTITQITEPDTVPASGSELPDVEPPRAA